MFSERDSHRSRPCIASPKSNPVVAHLRAARICWRRILRKLEGVLDHGSLPLASAPQRFATDRLGFSACLVGGSGFARVDSVRGSGAAVPGRCHRYARKRAFRIGNQPQQDLLPLSFKGVFVGAPPAQHAFSPLLLTAQGLEPCIRRGSTPLGRKLSRCTFSTVKT